MRLKVLTAILSLVAVTAFADVFSLWPFSGKSSLSNLDGALDSNKLWTEQVEINGYTMYLNVALIHRNFNDVLRELRAKRFYKGTAAANSNSILFEIPLDSGAKKRVYIVSIDGMESILQFTLLLPKNFKKDKTPGNWPHDMPLPPGAVPETVMSFPKRKAQYGQFNTSYTKEQTLADVSRILESNGWKPAGRELSRNASGGVFLREKPQSIMLFSVKNKESGEGCTATLFHRRIADSSF